MKSLIAPWFLSTVLLAGCGDNLAPDGTIVFAAALDGDTATDLWTIQPDGSFLERLTETPEDERYPRWSPDHQQVAYMVGAELFVLDRDVGEPRRVAGPVGRDGLGITAPAWSPDGSQLVYAAPRPPLVIDGEDLSYATVLHVVGVDGTGDAPFGDGTQRRTMTEPAWAADGWLAFLDADECPECPGGVVVALMRPDGSGYRFVAAADGNYGTPYPEHDLDWAPGSSRWAYTTGASGGYDSPGSIATSNRDGSGMSVLVADGAHMPRWSPDAASIAFLRADGIHAMSPDGSNSRLVVAATGIRGLDW